MSAPQQVGAGVHPSVEATDVALDEGVPQANEPKTDSRLVKALKRAWEWCQEQWFILGLGGVTAFAAAVPDLGKTGGYIRSEYTIKYCAVIIIFLLSGMSMKSRALLNAMSNMKLHVLTQGLSLGLIPVIGFGIATGLRQTDFNKDLADGLLVCLAMPTTASTNVVFTKLVRALPVAIAMPI